jgi:flagellin
MAVKLGSNISSLQTQRQLSLATDKLSSISEKLSSGMRINKASDDAAGLAIADSLRADSRIQAQAIRNINDGISAINIASGALSELSGITTRIAELAEQSANGVYSLTQRRALDSESDALTKEFNRVVATAKFNGINVFDVSSNGIRIQAGAGLENSYDLDFINQFSRAVGAGTFNTTQTITLSNGTSFPVLADLNNDGNLDLVTPVYSSGQISITLGNGDGTFGAISTMPLSWAAAVIAGDFNNDGIVDLIGGRGFGPSQISELFIGNGDGTFKASVSVGQSTLESGFLKIGDFNNDGNLDFLGHSTASGNTQINLGNGNGTFHTVQTISGLYGFNQGEDEFNTPIDFNQDGNIDLMTRNGAVISIMYGNGNGTFGALTTLATTSTGNIGGMARGDFNGDGINDIFVGGTTGGRANFLAGNADGTFKITQLDFLNNLYINEVGDFNNDGHLDFTGQNNIYYGNGDGSFGLAAGLGAGRVGDLNNDGVIDFINGNFSASLSIRLQNTNQSSEIETFNLNTQQNALVVLDKIKTYQERISSQLGQIGAYQSRLGYGLNNLQTQRLNTVQAESRIRDADVAEEAANYLKTQISQQVAASILGQANQIPQLALRLISGGSG